MKKLLVLLCALLLPLCALAEEPAPEATPVPDVTIRGVTSLSVTEVLIAREEAVFSEVVSKVKRGPVLEWTLLVTPCEGPVNVEYYFGDGSVARLPLTLPGVDASREGACLFWPVDLLNTAVAAELASRVEALVLFTGPGTGPCEFIFTEDVESVTVLFKEGKFWYCNVQFLGGRLRGGYVATSQLRVQLASRVPIVTWTPVTGEITRNCIVYSGTTEDYEGWFRWVDDGYDSRLRKGEEVKILCQQDGMLLVEDQYQSRGWIAPDAVAIE